MSTADTYVCARIDSATKERAAEALAAMGLSISDAIRLLMLRVVDERRLPFEVKAPNATTRKAIAELEAGKGTLHQHCRTDGGPECGRLNGHRHSSATTSARRQRRDKVQWSNGAAVCAWRTQRKVAGKQRDVVVVFSPQLDAGQLRGVRQTGSRSGREWEEMQLHPSVSVEAAQRTKVLVAMDSSSNLCCAASTLTDGMHLNFFPLTPTS